MRILCVSDHRDPIVYSSGIRGRFGDVDMILGAGDLDLEYYDFIVSSLNKSLLFVFGNHNLNRLGLYRSEHRETFDHNRVFEYMSPTFGSTYVGGRVVTVGDLIVGGVGGSRKYNGGPNQHSEFGVYRMFARMMPKLIFNRIFKGRYLDILLTHAPPRGIGDMPDPCHLGFKAFLWFMRVFKPLYLVHGHVHLYDRNAVREHQYGSTRVVNAYDHTIIEIDDRELQRRARSEAEPSEETRKN